MHTLTRLLDPPKDSFFLLGPRGTGKTTWLSQHLPGSHRIDLLESQSYLRLGRDPSLLEGWVGGLKKNDWVVIDEIQKLPELLDEVHRLIEKRGFRFALTGSSARKLKRAGANLLAGRALMREFFPLVSQEMEGKFDLDRCLRWGSLPKAFSLKEPQDFLESYFHTYLKEEIREEGIVRRIEPFVRFLEVAANFNGQILNAEAVARETGSKRPTVDKWFQVLKDTLITFDLPPWRPGFKVRESAHPKLYWFDNGVVRAASGRLREDDIDSVWLGYALETWLLHEIRAYDSYQRKRLGIYYYGVPSESDIDLVLETRKPTHSRKGEIIGVEIKSAKEWKREWERHLRNFKKDGFCEVKRMIGIYRGKKTLHFDDFTVYPAEEFCRELQAGNIA